MCLFLFLSLVGFANMGLFYYYGNSKLSLNILDYIEMGNLGFSSSYCRDTPLGVGQLSLE
jgi:hypothetical protein